MITQEKVSALEPTGDQAKRKSNNRPAVLLAEDDQSLRRYFAVVLERAGYRVIAAADGLKAMEIILSEHIDLVVTDALMPNLTGYELCRFLRDSPSLAHTPVILLSALEQSSGRRENERVDAFLAKPVSPETLVASVHQLIGAGEELAGD